MSSSAPRRRRRRAAFGSPFARMRWGAWARRIDMRTGRHRGCGAVGVPRKWMPTEDGVCANLSDTPIMCHVQRRCDHAREFSGPRGRRPVTEKDENPGGQASSYQYHQIVHGRSVNRTEARLERLYRPELAAGGAAAPCSDVAGADAGTPAGGAWRTRPGHEGARSGAATGNGRSRHAATVGPAVGNRRRVRDRFHRETPFMTPAPRRSGLSPGGSGQPRRPDASLESTAG